MTASLHVLVLAAGASIPRERPGPQAPGGRPALRRVVSTAVAFAGNAVTVVLGSNARQTVPVLAGLPASIVLNRQWEEGAGSSLRAGIASLPGSCDAVLILSGDQPRVTIDDLRQLTDVWKHDDATIAAGLHGRQTGPPVIFPRLFFAELARLHGDQCVRTIVQRNSYRLVRVPMPNADPDAPEGMAAPGERFQNLSASE